MNCEPELQSNGLWRVVVNGEVQFHEALSLAQFALIVGGVKKPH